MRLLILLTLLSLSACATLTRGVNQTVSVNTPGVRGAICTLSSESIGSHTVMTPGSISLPKSRHTISVACEKECYHPAQGALSAKFEPLTIGNVIAGGGVGLVVDWISGAYTNYEPVVSVPMEPIEGCRVRG